MTSTAAQWYALIAQLVHDYNSISGRVAGKKAIQKLFYVLQRRTKEAKHYAFSFYNYGVFSQDLARDIVEADRYQFINVEYDENTHAYMITPGANFEANKRFVPSFYSLEKYQDVFDSTAKELELITTIMFVCDEEKISERSAILERVHDLKPKFQKSEIKNYIHDYCGRI